MKGTKLVKGRKYRFLNNNILYFQALSFSVSIPTDVVFTLDEIQDERKQYGDDEQGLVCTFTAPGYGKLEADKYGNGRIIVKHMELHLHSIVGVEKFK